MNNNSIHLEKVTQSQLTELVTLSIQTFSDAFEHLNTPENFQYYINTSLNKEKLSQELNNPDSEFFFAKFKDETLGFLKLNFNEAQNDLKEKTGMELERIYVLQKYQGNKIGELLLNFSLDIAKKRKLEYVWLGVWDQNQRAIDFYQRNGYKIIGSHPFYLGDEKQTDLILKYTL